jgi:hypothetical protein
VVCDLRRDLDGHVRCRACGTWFPRSPVSGEVAATHCPECSAPAETRHRGADR